MYKVGIKPSENGENGDITTEFLRSRLGSAERVEQWLNPPPIDHPLIRLWVQALADEVKQASTITVCAHPSIDAIAAAVIIGQVLGRSRSDAVRYVIGEPPSDADLSIGIGVRGRFTLDNRVRPVGDERDLNLVAIMPDFLPSLAGLARVCAQHLREVRGAGRRLAAPSVQDAYWSWLSLLGCVAVLAPQRAVSTRYIVRLALSDLQNATKHPVISTLKSGLGLSITPQNVARLMQWEIIPLLAGGLGKPEVVLGFLNTGKSEYLAALLRERNAVREIVDRALEKVDPSVPAAVVAVQAEGLPLPLFDMVAARVRNISSAEMAIVYDYKGSQAWGAVRTSPIGAHMPTTFGAAEWQQFGQDRAMFRCAPEVLPELLSFCEELVRESQHADEGAGGSVRIWHADVVLDPSRWDQMYKLDWSSIGPILSDDLSWRPPRILLRGLSDWSIENNNLIWRRESGVAFSARLGDRFYVSPSLREHEQQSANLLVVMAPSARAIGVFADEDLVNIPDRSAS